MLFPPPPAPQASLPQQAGASTKIYEEALTKHTKLTYISIANKRHYISSCIEQTWLVVVDFVESVREGFAGINGGIPVGIDDGGELAVSILALSVLAAWVDLADEEAVGVIVPTGGYW